jgi:hypothetical protein
MSTSILNNLSGTQVPGTTFLAARTPRDSDGHPKGPERSGGRAERVDERWHRGVDPPLKGVPPYVSPRRRAPLMRGLWREEARQRRLA